MTEPTKKRIYCYGRRGQPLTPEQRAKLTPVLPNEVDFIAVELGLEQLDDKPYVSVQFTQRVIRHLFSDLNVPLTDAQLLVSLRMEHPTYKGFLKSLKDEAIYKQRVLQQREHQKLMEAQAWEKKRKKNDPLAKTAAGNYGLMGTDFGMRYFFEEKLQYLHLIEGMLKEHTDEYLMLAVNAYPQGLMGWIQYHYSFDRFWIKVQRLHLMEQFDFSEPGLKSVRRLANYLFTWNFRRYVQGEIIRAHARFMPREYRHLHKAAHLDLYVEDKIDPQYDEVEFEDEHEEPGDNIGNR